MKCIKNIKTGNIHRVDDDAASLAVKNLKSITQEWTYCPKSEWKAQQKKEG